MNKIPRTFCVTLKETPLRTRGFMDLAQAAGLEVTPFYGILGSRSGIVPKFRDEIESPGSSVFMNEQALGCNLSHFILWHVLKHLPDEEFLIFEDDAIIPEDFAERFQKAYAQLPTDWQMAYVGWIRYGKDISPVVISDSISIRIPSATHAYLVKKSILDDLIACMMPFQSNIDLTIIHRLLPKIRYYVFDPSLVSQRSYLNVADSVWTSLVYDWKNDIYGCKKELLTGLSLIDGWYSLEIDKKENWRWSKNNFVIKTPPKIDSMTLVCSTPMENVVEFFLGEKIIRHQLSIGEHSLDIPVKGYEKIEGKLEKIFIPSQVDKKTTDDRPLGLCLKRIILNMGIMNISVEIKELSSLFQPTMSFKL